VLESYWPDSSMSALIRCGVLYWKELYWRPELGIM